MQVAFGSPTRAFFRLLVYAGFTLPLMVVQAAAVALQMPLMHRLPRWYHQRCLRLLGLKLVQHGQPVDTRPALIVSNHTSYLDITVLGALIEGSFVAKAEIADWPFFGWLAKLQRTVFVDRRRGRTASQRDEMTRRLEAGDRLILFPEGTSDDGNRVLPFRSALFSVAEKRPHGRPVTVQPVSVAYTKLDGVPMGRYLRPFVAWYGDMDIAPHMWNMLGLGTITVEVTFHAPVTIDDFSSRKAMSQACHQTVARGVSESLAGRQADIDASLKKAA
ncbi:lyso-ornithine lipid acyltransferase [Limimonas halophila]|uniref:Lyso-ornithine lipid acyltransferase n=1 Tax=Limimonas halophila TaxID=1082479 RepID=A0A1G7SKA8_9PROT|nr:lysophospholipid acyltransferase family protein [Limimonas halophila]SDG23516.1 lyso-ornithine lipid acyltransferase [Limimonas halophila]